MILTLMFNTDPGYLDILPFFTFLMIGLQMMMALFASKMELKVLRMVR